MIFIAGTVDYYYYNGKIITDLFFFLNQNAEVKQKLGASEKEKEVCCLEKIVTGLLTHWLLELLAKNAFFFYILEIFGLDIGQISSNLLKKAFAMWQHVFLCTNVASAKACTEITILDDKETYIFRLLVFNFLLLTFSLFFFFAAVIDLRLGLLPAQKILRRQNLVEQFLP